MAIQIKAVIWVCFEKPCVWAVFIVILLFFFSDKRLEIKPT